MKFKYKTNPETDNPGPGETELAEEEIHKVVTHTRADTVLTVREDIESAQRYGWSDGIDDDDPCITIIEENGNIDGANK